MMPCDFPCVFRYVVVYVAMCAISLWYVSQSVVVHAITCLAVNDSMHEFQPENQTKEPQHSDECNKQDDSAVCILTYNDSGACMYVCMFVCMYVCLIIQNAI